MDQEGLADEEVSNKPAMFSQHALWQYGRILSKIPRLFGLFGILDQLDQRCKVLYVYVL